MTTVLLASNCSFVTSLRCCLETVVWKGVYRLWWSALVPHSGYFSLVCVLAYTPVMVMATVSDCCSQASPFSVRRPSGGHLQDFPGCVVTVSSMYGMVKLNFNLQCVCELLSVVEY